MLVQDTFADNMREFRIRAGLSQEMLAEKSGMHRTYIGSIEQKRANISLKQVERIAEALDLDPAILFVDGAAARENAVTDYTNAVEALIEEAPNFVAGDFALCEWGGDGSVRFEPIGVYSEDLTLRILCILVEEGYGETLDELVSAYEQVSGPVLDFVHSFKNRELAKKQHLLMKRKGLSLDGLGAMVGKPEEGWFDEGVIGGNGPVDLSREWRKHGKDEAGEGAGADDAAGMAGAAGASELDDAAAADLQDFKAFLSQTIKEAVAEYFDEHNKAID